MLQLFFTLLLVLLTAQLTPPRPIPPRTAPPIGGRVPLGEAPGFATPPNRPVHSPVLAYDQERGRLAVAWLSWGYDPADSYAAQLWVRTQDAGGTWASAEAATTTPVRAYFGGLALTWSVSGTLLLGYGDGRGSIWLRERSGSSWGAPERLTSGQISALQTDDAGTLHALIISGRAVVQGQPRYGTRTPGGAWSWTNLPTGLSYNGQLALLPLPDGRLRRFVLLNDATGRASPLSLWWSDDGRRWGALALPLDQHLPRPEHPAATSLIAAQRPDGSGMVAVAWSQPAGPGPVAGGVFAAISTDAGATWGDEEIVAQHRADGSFADGAGGTVGGFEPSLAYSRELDQLAVSWVEDDLKQAGRSASSSNRIARTRLAARQLTPGTSTWKWAISLTSVDPLGPPILSGWGLRGHLWGDASGTRHWLLTIDERNMQSRIALQQVDLPGFLVEVPG